MSVVARRLNLRCFIDGIEVPIIGCRCTFPTGSAATAEISLVPSDEAYKIEPRAFVALFYYENYDYDRKPNGDIEMQRLGPKDLRRWKLLYSGESATVAYNKTASGRSVTFQCVDHTNYWDFIKQYTVSLANGGIELFENAFMGVKTDRVKNYDVPGADLSTHLFVWLTASKGPDGKPNLYLGVQRVMREMWFASNDFYARAFNRLRIGDQIVGVPGDESAAKLFQLQFFEKFIKNQIGGGGGEISLRQMIEMLLGNVYHTFVTIPAPRFDRKGVARGFSPSSKSKQDAALLSENIDRSKSWPEASLNYTVIKPDTWFTVPPACNVVFPHQYVSLAYQQNPMQEPTRLFMRTQLLFAGGADKWMCERFYSPDFETFNQQLYKEGGYLQRMAQTTGPHEDFVGINPAETWQPDMGAYVAPGARRDYLARLSDYLFWKMRFGSRGVDVSGPFNPNLLPGYAGCVINNPANNRQITRHYLGQIQTVTHVINQQQGGWTHFSMAGAHVHDETADFDGKGRSLEEVTNRGTDGFIDDRYDSSRIGKEVYQVLFGCDSLWDKYNEIVKGSTPDDTDDLSRRLHALKEGGLGDIALSVEAIHGMYQRVVDSKSDVDAFSQSISWRPKANMLEMMGTNIVNYGQTDSVVDLEALAKEDPDLVANEGFFATCVDPEAFTTVNATFKAVVARSVPVSVVTDVAEISFPIGNQESKVIFRAAQKRISTTYKDVQKSKKGNYELSSHLKARRVKVQAYVDSLRLRGIRG